MPMGLRGRDTQVKTIKTSRTAAQGSSGIAIANQGAGHLGTILGVCVIPLVAKIVKTGRFYLP